MRPSFPSFCGLACLPRAHCSSCEARVHRTIDREEKRERGWLLPTSVSHGSLFPSHLLPQSGALPPTRNKQRPARKLLFPVLVSDCARWPLPAAVGERSLLPAARSPFVFWGTETVCWALCAWVQAWTLSGCPTPPFLTILFPPVLFGFACT